MANKLAPKPEIDGSQPETISPNLESLLALQAEVDRKKREAVSEIREEIVRLEAIHAANLAKLRGLLTSLGETVSSEEPNHPSSVVKVEHSARFVGTKYCPYCQIPGHDGRAHRGQPKPRQFGRQELEVYGLVPPTGLPTNYGQSEKIA